ncbi:MAG TPA: PAS domain S-box protein [Saprospiraceae bacterium]|nr:PAS domain S-box protein [Saprospiraceae bacterium]
MKLNFKIPIPTVLGLSKAETKILVTVLSILIGLCTLAFFAHRNSKRLIESSERIEVAEDFKNHIQEVLSITLNMESRVRGFVITGDERYLEPPHKSIADISLHMHQLMQTPGITETQMQHVTQLTELVEAKSVLTSQIIEVGRQKGMKEAATLIAEGKDKILLDQVRSVAGSLIAETDISLDKLKEEHKSAIHHFALTFYFLLLKIGVTVSTVVFLLTFYFIRRNKSEKVLRDSKELFHNILDHTASIISIKDLSGRYILVNKSFENAFDTKEESIKGKTVYDLVDKETADQVRHDDMEMLKKQKQIKTVELLPDDGGVRHYVSIRFPLFDANHLPYAVACISTDETEKIQSELQHRTQMSRILDLFNNAPCGYQATDTNGTVIEINDTLLKWLGYARHEIIGKMPSRNLISKESQDKFAYYFPLLKTGEIKSVYDVEVTYLRKDGSKIDIVANTMGQYDDERNFLYTRTSIFDLSFRKKVDELATHN